VLSNERAHFTNGALRLAGRAAHHVPDVHHVRVGREANVGACLLGWLGLADLIAGDVAEFVRICARLASDFEGTSALRGGLRERMRASSLVDEAGLTRELERSYEAIWMEHMHLEPDARR
jgi:hypothetical protein